MQNNTHHSTRRQMRDMPANQLLRGEKTHLQDLGTPFCIWQRHVDDAVKASWTDEGAVNGTRPVGGAKHHHTTVVLKAIHLQQYSTCANR